MTVSPRFPVIAFDLDGTLVLTLEPKAQAAGVLWHEVFGVAPDAVKSVFLRHSGIPRYEIFQRIADAVLFRRLSDAEYQRLSVEFTRRNIQALRGYPFVPGASELLCDLVQAGIFLAVSTSADPAEVDARLSGDHSRFFGVVMGSHGNFHKGLPHIEHLARMTGRSTGSILLVGDDPNDLYLARAAGASIALVAQSHPMEELETLSPDILVPSLADLRSYVLPVPSL